MNVIIVGGFHNGIILHFKEDHLLPVIIFPGDGQPENIRIYHRDAAPRKYHNSPVRYKAPYFEFHNEIH